MADHRIRVALIFGGRSGEHDVSCYSAAGMLSHLSPDRYEVVPIWITPDGQWVVGSDKPRTGSVDVPLLLSMTPYEPDGIADDRGTSLDSILDALAVLRTVDVVLPALHGPFGEDGTLQSLLASAGVPYVGNGILTSAIGMDKEHTKNLLRTAGLDVTDAVVLRHGRDTLTDEEQARLGLPVFVKPAHGGSSLGVSRVDEWTQLSAAVAVARESEDKILVEAAVLGREVDLAVLEHPDGRVLAGPALEISVTAEHEFFDYEAKYSGAGSAFDIPAKLAPEIAEQLADQAVRVFEVLDCVGLLRVDFFLRDGVHPVVNEVNTLPGLTPHSQFPQIWQAAGVTYAELLNILITTALVRRGRLDRPALPPQSRHEDRTLAWTRDRLPGSVEAGHLL